MKTFTKLSLAVLLLLAATPVFAKNASVKVINQSKFAIHELYLSPHEQDQWGPDQLQDEVIEVGATFTLHSIPCGDYDIKVVDEDGDECVVEDVTLCDDHFWKITNKDLLNCEGYDE